MALKLRTRVSGRRASIYRERVLEEIARRKGTPTEYHLRIVLAVINSDASFR